MPRQCGQSGLTAVKRHYLLALHEWNQLSNCQIAWALDCEDKNSPEHRVDSQINFEISYNIASRDIK